MYQKCYNYTLFIDREDAMRVRMIIALCVLVLAGVTAWQLHLFETEEQRFHRLKKTDSHMCMALNIYWEAGALTKPAEPDEGLYMVGSVTKRRSEIGKRGGWPTTICGVVWQKMVHKNGRRVTPAFSWTITEAAEKIPRPSPRWELSKRIASEVLRGKWQPRPELASALSYRRCDNKNVAKRNRRWHNSQEQLGRVGNHCFSTHANL